MISENTVIILGAGASKPYGYPTMVDMEKDIFENFERYYSEYVLNWLDLDDWDKNANLDKVKEFLEKYEGSNVMIDEFISEEENQKYRTIGKLAVACSIVDAENNSLFRRDSYDTASDWYTLFFQLLYRNRQQDEKFKLSNYKISFITFNYDRSLEYFLHDSLTNLLSLSQKENIDDMNSLKIIHIYRQIMGLDWQHPAPTLHNGKRASVDYCQIKNYEQIKRCANNIATVYKDREQLPQLVEARKLIENSKRILFLGFGFDDFNLKNLGIPEILKSSHDIFWTQQGLNNQKKAFLHDMFLAEGHNSESRKSVNGNCKDLIDDHLF